MHLRNRGCASAVEPQAHHAIEVEVDDVEEEGFAAEDVEREEERGEWRLGF